jgi:putative transposase
MARLPRIEFAGIAQHVIQRGVDRMPCFLDDRDRRFYQSALKQAIKVNPCQIHAYVLMTNHVHLLVTGLEVGNISSMMQSLGRRYVRYFNTRHERTGTLWEGRFKSNLVDSDHYVLACYRYIEMNPVRAHIVDNPYQYQWSSIHGNATGTQDNLLDSHPTYLALGSERHEREENYRAIIDHPVPQAEVKAIRDHVNQGKPIGSLNFRNQVTNLIGRSADLMPIGRPRKSRVHNR